MGITKVISVYKEGGQLVATFIPVKVGGVTLTHATCDDSIHPGDVIEVYRNNDVVPTIRKREVKS